MTKWFLAAAAAACVSTAAIAGNIDFNPTTGVGYVNKGTVQSTLGLNNPDLQALAQSGGIVFSFSQNESWQAVCTWITDDGHTEPRIHNKTIRRTNAVNSNVSWQGRNNSSGINGPLTGFFLTGFAGSGTTSEPVPNVGDPCEGGDPARPKPGTYTSVTLLSTQGAELTVNGVHLWP